MGKALERVGHGIFTWDGTERRSDRYGAFVVASQPYESSDRVAAHTDLTALRALEGKRIHIWCEVVATRTSGHLGDLFHRIKPSTPEVGEKVDLGVGILRLEPAWDGGTQIALEPGPYHPRAKFWYDPRKLYRLHDQTVNVFVEETTAAFSPAPDLKAEVTEPESIDNTDGSFQTKGTTNGVPYRIPPDVERIGDGLLVLTMPGGNPGRRRKLVK